MQRLTEPSPDANTPLPIPNPPTPPPPSRPQAGYYEIGIAGGIEHLSKDPLDWKVRGSYRSPAVLATWH